MNFGRYEILEELGAGSMGTVYRARDTALDRVVALKTIRHGPDPDPELRERFYREAWACARLHHPAIIAIYDLGESGDGSYIAMELLAGADFRKLIDQRTEISLSAKIEAMAQVCEALAHAHRNGIVHRDVKPSNLFLVDGKNAKVLDFGMARLPGSSLTMAGKALGTPNYMAPEQILGISTDERADLFSAAVVFFEFLVYQHPFQSESIPRQIVNREPVSLFDYDTTLPAPLDRILATGMAKEPAERYRTGGEFAAALRGVIQAQSAQTAEFPAVSGAPISPREAAAAAPSTARKACRYCGASNRGAAVYCIQCGGRLTTAAGPIPPPSPPLEAPPLEAPPALSDSIRLGATTIVIPSRLPPAPAAALPPASDNPVVRTPIPPVHLPTRSRLDSPVRRPQSAVGSAWNQYVDRLSRLPRPALVAIALISLAIVVFAVWTLWLSPIRSH
jgi:serine/threonine-protein kinase